MLRFSDRFHADFQLKSGWIEPLRLGGHAPFSPPIRQLVLTVLKLVFTNFKVGADRFFIIQEQI